MNKRGFTLIELLGVIVILSIVMIIAIPNITATLERSKRDQYLTDATKLISKVEYELRKDAVVKPAQGQWIKISLKYIDTSDIEKDPDGVEYSLTNSYVVVTKDSAGYLKYYVNLVSNHAKDGTENWWGIKLADKDSLKNDERYNLFKKNITLANTNDINTITGSVPAEKSEY